MSAIKWVILGVFVINFTNINSQVVINEIQSSNHTTIKDEFNEFPDWIELKNTSDTPIKLQDWELYDKIADTVKWKLPDITIQPDNFLLVYASGRDLLQEPVFWNTIIDVGDVYNYLVPSDTVSSNWKQLVYNDTSWPNGKSGFGYGDNDDSTTLEQPVISVYLRKVFTIENLSEIKELYLNMDYDDSFVAYLNGVEIARSNIGTSGSEVSYNQFADGNHEAVIYNGGQPEIFDISSYVDQLLTGDNVLAVEVHNVSQSSSDFTAIPILTIGSSSAEEGVKQSKHFPLGTRGLHTNFKIKSDGETIVLINSVGTLVDSISSVAIGPDLSYGRLSDNPESLEYFMIPTPGTENPSSGYKLLSNDTVTYSYSGGYYSGGFTLNLEPYPGDTIYYTLDGTEPTSASLVYSGGIQISDNTIVKARILKSGYLPSPIFSNTYITERDTDLPLVSISTNPDNLWNYYTGLYEMGPGAGSDYPYFGANFWMEWEYPFQFELYSTNETKLINQQVGGKIFGAWSRAQGQKSFALMARKGYGQDYFEYPIFKQKSLEKYRSIVLRNSGNDWGHSVFRDGLITGISSHLGVDHQAFQPVTTYLNGEYWGIYNLREKINEHFLALNNDVDPDEVIILEKDGEVVTGDNTEYLNIKGFLSSNSSLATEEKFEFIDSQIDLDNFIKYNLIQIYVHNDDWPGNNMKFWKTTQPGSKWKYILYDTDFGFGIWNDNNYTDNMLDFALEPYGPGWPNPPWSTLLLRRLVTNEGFRFNFINQMADNVNTTFTTTNVNAYTDSIQNLMKNEMQYHLPRWGRDMNDWNWQVQRIKNWGQNRPAYMLNHIESQFNLPNQHNVRLEVSNVLHGKIRLNTISPKSYPFSGTYFEEVPIEIEAVPAAGYKFVKWEGEVSHSDLLFKYDLESGATFKAVFEQANPEDESLVINEINYNSSDNYDAADWVELYNNGNTTINLYNYLFTELNSDSGFYVGPSVILKPGEFLVLSKNISKFKKVYPEVTNVIGEFLFGLSSSGDEIRLENSYGTNMDAVDYLPYAPWPVEANGTGATLELIHPDLDNGQAENWISVTEGGTPGRANSGYSSVKEMLGNSESFASVSSFPNVFSDYTTIKVILPESQEIKIEIVDINGRLIQQIDRNYLTAGEHYYDWIPSQDITGGIFIIRLLTSNQIYNAKVSFIKR